tara:strand:+ start:716 stop:910 length:195 start_codon:yes stop_codon:yes gene_type:complete
MSDHVKTASSNTSTKPSDRVNTYKEDTVNGTTKNVKNINKNQMSLEELRKSKGFRDLGDMLYID